MQTILCPVSVDMLTELYVNQKLTDEKIVALIGKGATVKRVRSWRHRFGIETIPRWSRNEVPVIEDRLQALLVGSMLGDGRLVFRTHATYYTENHQATQKEYLEWKVKQWGSWVKPGAIKPVLWKTMGGEYPGFRFNTVAHESLNVWQELFYTNREKGWKRLLPSVVDLVDSFALAVWYLDDGCAGWWPGITFGADPESRQVALTIFEKFGLHPRWQLKKGNTGEFHMEREDTAIRFMEIISPHVPECMKCKLGPFGFQGPMYQVRQKLAHANIEQMIEDGLSARKIGSAIGVGATTVSRHMAKKGLHTNCAVSPFEQGMMNKALYAERHPDHNQEGLLFIDPEGFRVNVKTAVLHPRSDAPQTLRWSFGLWAAGQEPQGDVYSCLCLDAKGVSVIAEFRIPVSVIGNRRVIHIYESYKDTQWAPYVVGGDDDVFSLFR